MLTAILCALLGASILIPMAWRHRTARAALARSMRADIRRGDYWVLPHSGRRLQVISVSPAYVRYKEVGHWIIRRSTIRAFLTAAIPDVP